MKAYRFAAWQRPPELVDVDELAAGPGQVVLRVAGAGACHSDLHVMEYPAGLLPWQLPFTLGHETTGWVASAADGWREGEAVAVYGPLGCGRCARCAVGSENYCERAREIPYAGYGLGLDGGMAEYVVVSARSLVPLGDLDPVAAAPLTDAGLTPYHAVKRSLPLLVPGSSAVVIGVGGLGHLAVQILRALSPARIVAVDTAQDKLELAREVGADECLTPDKAQGPADLVLDFVGSNESMALAVSLAKTQGDITIVGLAMGVLSFSVFPQPWESSVQSTYWGSKPELAELLALARAGNVTAHVEPFALTDAPKAYERMREGSLRGRAVIVPND